MNKLYFITDKLTNKTLIHLPRKNTTNINTQTNKITTQKMYNMVYFSIFNNKITKLSLYNFFFFFNNTTQEIGLNFKNMN